MRQFTIHDKENGKSDHCLSALRVFETIPDLTETEVEQIIDLNVSESCDFGNILVVRTA